jgi:hypothetical protein
LYEKLGLNE